MKIEVLVWINGYRKNNKMYDELPLWSAPFGLKLLDFIEYKSNITAMFNHHFIRVAFMETWKSIVPGIRISELLTLTEMWDEENPCLIMIKNLKNVRKC